MAGTKAVQRPSWLMMALGLLGLLASLGPAAFSMVMDWQDTKGLMQRSVEAMATSLARDVAESLDRNHAVLSRLSVLLADKDSPSQAVLTDLIDPKSSGWAGVYSSDGGLVRASLDKAPAVLPGRPLSFVRKDSGEVLALLVAPAADGKRWMAVATSAGPVLHASLNFVTTVETASGDVVFRGTPMVSGPFDVSWGETLVSRQPVPGFELIVSAGLPVSSVLPFWGAKALRTGLAALLTALVVVPILLLMAKRLVRDNQASAALEVANQELSRSNADLEQFAYVASHDLKEPLRNIASYVQLLQRRYQGKLDEDADAFIGYTVEGVRRMQVIINELLAYSRIGTGPLSTSPVQTGAVVSAVLGNLKSAIAEAGAVVDVVGPLPVVMGDPAQLTSVFQNLLGNALKYRRDDVRPEVKVTVAEMAAAWRFSIADNGIGIDPAYQQQVFELFKRLHTRDRFTGSGIGLAVCQRVVERHGGSIWVDSIPGQGACFHFTLPKIA